MFVGGGVGVGHSILAEEVACIGIVGVFVSVAFGVQAVRPACDGGIRQAVEGIIGEGLSLSPREGIHDGFDVAHRIIIVSQILERIARGYLRGRDVLQASVVHVPVVVREHGVNLVRAANHLDHTIGGIVGDGLGISIRARNADGEHVVIVPEGHDFAIGICHRDGQIGEVADEADGMIISCQGFMLVPHIYIS